MVKPGNDDVYGSSGDGTKAAVRSDKITSIQIPNTAHAISTDSWYQVAFILTNGVNSAYVLGYPGTVMVPLGWIGGVIGLILATLASLHANELIARIHEHGGKRHIRYRDLAGYIYGKSAYYVTWTMQYLNLYLINVGYVILAGNSLKAVYHLYRDDDAMKLAQFVVIAGIIGAIFAISIPHLSALRVWLVVSTLFSLVYIVLGCVLSIKDGLRTPPRDYTIPGERSDKIFSMIGAAANIVFSFNTGMLPEIQATVRPPVVKNTMKALNFQFTAGVMPMYAVIFSGYWAYGNLTSEYLFNNTHGLVWLKTAANISAFLQSIISLHIFASPMYEYLDTKFDITGSALAARNVAFRVLVRGGYMAVTTFISALLPFLGDFMSLTGALCTYPLTFILAHHMYLKAKGNKLSSQQKIWHWINVVFFSLLACAALVSAIREIHKDSKTFHLFADL